MANWQRTHTCGELDKGQDGHDVVLNGWIDNNRDHGHLLFLDVRDRYGVTQVVVEKDTVEKETGAPQETGEMLTNV